MLSRQPGQNSWPEANKAAVLASAFHPIGTADQSGLGAVVMNVSDDTYRFGRFINECNATCNPLGVADFDASGNRDHFVSLTAGQVVKVAIAWDADSNPGGATDVIGADIDLSVLGPTNAFVCGSFSVNNTWESCQFTVPSTGTYTFREHLFGSEASWPGTFMGMAWSIKIIPNPCSAPAIRVPAAGATFANLSTANGPTFFDNYPGWGVDQSGRERVFLYTNTANHHITFTDTNSAIDLHIVRLTCSTQPIVPTVLAQGSNSASVHSAPPGAYYLIADGSNGFVGVDTFRVIVGAPIP
jgi:hypothetical protein